MEDFFSCRLTPSGSFSFVTQRAALWFGPLNIHMHVLCTSKTGTHPLHLNMRWSRHVFWLIAPVSVLCVFWRVLMFCFHSKHSDIKAVGWVPAGVSKLFYRPGDNQVFFIPRCKDFHSSPISIAASSSCLQQEVLLRLPIHAPDIRPLPNIFTRFLCFLRPSSLRYIPAIKAVKFTGLYRL